MYDESPGLLTRKNIINLLLLGIMILGIPVGTKLVETQKALRSQAAGELVDIVADGTHVKEVAGKKYVVDPTQVTLILTPPTTYPTLNTSLIPASLVTRAYAQIPDCDPNFNNGQGACGEEFTCDDQGGIGVQHLLGTDSQGCSVGKWTQWVRNDSSDGHGVCRWSLNSYKEDCPATPPVQPPAASCNDSDYEFKGCDTSQCGKEIHICKNDSTKVKNQVSLAGDCGKVANNSACATTPTGGSSSDNCARHLSLCLSGSTAKSLWCTDVTCNKPDQVGCWTKENWGDGGDGNDSSCTQSACFRGSQGNQGSADQGCKSSKNYPDSVCKQVPDNSTFEDGCTKPPAPPPATDSCYKCVTGNHFQVQNLSVCGSSAPRCDFTASSTQGPCLASQAPTNTAVCNYQPPAPATNVATCTLEVSGNGSHKTITPHFLVNNVEQDKHGYRLEFYPDSGNNGVKSNPQNGADSITFNYEPRSNPYRAKIEFQDNNLTQAKTSCLSSEFSVTSQTQITCLKCTANDQSVNQWSSVACGSTTPSDCSSSTALNTVCKATSSTVVNGSCGPAGSVTTCFKCGTDNKWASATCPATGTIPACSASITGNQVCTGGGAAAGQSCGPARITTQKIKISKDIVSWANIAEEDFVPDPAGFMIKNNLNLANLFADANIRGAQTFYVRFIASNGAVVDKSFAVNIVGSSPAITECVPTIALGGGALTVTLNGREFGTKGSSSKVLLGETALRVAEGNWNNNRIVANLDNIPSNISSGSTLPLISVVRDPDQEKVTVQSCSVETAQVNINATPVCGASADSLGEIDMSIAELSSVGVGSTASPTSTTNKVKRKVKLGKGGVIQGSQELKLQAGHLYQATFKADNTTRVKTPPFTASAGTTNLSDVKFPWGDIAPRAKQDGKVNISDYRELLGQWSCSASKNRSADVNHDGCVNVIDYRCLLDNYNKEDETDL